MNIVHTAAKTVFCFFISFLFIKKKVSHTYFTFVNSAYAPNFVHSSARLVHSVFAYIRDK